MRNFIVNGYTMLFRKQAALLNVLSGRRLKAVT